VRRSQPSSGSALPALPWWRGALAAVLIFDVLAGAIANFTRGTNDFYAARPSLRWVFIAVHVHLPLVALLLGVDWWPSVAAWAYTIAAASAVNALGGRGLVGGVALSMGLLLVMLLPFASTVVAATAAMFVLKVVFAFGVDHYAAAPNGSAAGP
jgi:hypothetical protein